MINKLIVLILFLTAPCVFAGNYFFPRAEPLDDEYNALGTLGIDSIVMCSYDYAKQRYRIRTKGSLSQAQQDSIQNLFDTFTELPKSPGKIILEATISNTIFYIDASHLTATNYSVPYYVGMYNDLMLSLRNKKIEYRDTTNILQFMDLVIYEADLQEYVDQYLSIYPLDDMRSVTFGGP